MKHKHVPVFIDSRRGGISIPAGWYSSAENSNDNNAAPTSFYQWVKSLLA
jgi:hypothetical protein